MVSAGLVACLGSPGVGKNGEEEHPAATEQAPVASAERAAEAPQPSAESPAEEPAVEAPRVRAKPSAGAATSGKPAPPPARRASDSRAEERSDIEKAPAPAESAADPDPSPRHPAAPRPSDVPEIVEIEVPEGTVLELELLTALDSAINRVGDEIQARTVSAVHVKGERVLPEGTYVEGRVTEVEASGRVKGRARLGFTFDRLSTRTGVLKIRTSYVSQEAASGKTKDAKVIGGGAGIGAVIGGIIGGKKGAAIGATIGGAGGTGVVLATKGEEIRLATGTEINVRLDEPIRVQQN
jgi:hypothetical protein